MNIKHEPLDAPDEGNNGRTEDDDSGSKGAQLVGMALTSWLSSRGWVVEALPGDEIRLVQGESTIKPFSVVEGLVSGTMLPDDWRSLSERAGIADVDLGQTPAH